MKKLFSLLICLALAVNTFGQLRVGGNARARGSWGFGGSLPGGSLVIDGNSLAFGTGMQYQESGNIAAILDKRLNAAYGPNRVTTYNVATGGKLIEQMITGGAADVDIHFVPRRHNVVVWWECVNSRLLTIPQDTLTQVRDLWRTYGTDRKAAGFTVIAITMSATPWTSNPEQRFRDWEDSERYQIDTMLRADAGSAYIDYVADLAEDAEVAANIQVHGAETTHPENFQTGDIHQTHYGYPHDADPVFPIVASAFGYPDPQPELRKKIRAYFPLKNPDLPINPTAAPDYWGNNNAGPGPNAVQHDDYMEFPNIGGSNVQISALGGVHTLHARSTGFSVSGWFYPQDIGRVFDQWVNGVWEGGDGQREYLVYIPATDDQVVFKTSDDGSDANTHSVTSAVTMTNGNPYFFTASFSGSSICISVNNETPVCTATPSVKTNSTSRYDIGNGNPQMSLVASRVQNFMFATAPLTTDQQTYLYNSGAPRANLF